ncbi:methionine ABC transporter ATP-binding protein [Streptomyces sp. WZ.A104]|uniref:ABC transporter ATP-binding protein n=1 Tax=Streptomyces sp. WZ.A104 TaxID=2023771 RepID=UPI000BBC820F|nr:ATP-binding cassette domain-containing protein [Streptomyces sp. WZ.A104]PCG84204.1 methionine ABC transporter ATP-binding protein [Streptomyces sp. WZ.A104]
MSLIEVTDVRKSFSVRKGGMLRGKRTTVDAVHGISLRVEQGETVGYIGPNGAGKSTMIKMLTGILTPTSGTVQVAGLVPSRERVALARRIGVVFGQRSTLWWDLPLEDSFRLIHHLYRIPDERFRENFDRYVELLDMEGFLRTPVRQLSLGQRMRGELTAALLHDPEILFLDEPTIGLDAVSKSTVRGFLEELNTSRGTTIILTTHDLEDIERLCGRIVVVDDGRIGFDGSLEGLRSRMNADRTLVVDLKDPVEALTLPGVRVTRVEGPRQWLAFPTTTSASAVIAQVASQADIVDLSLREPDIADIVQQVVSAG